MCVVIVGGHDRMVCTYKEICKQYNCKPKVYTQMPTNMKNVMGNPDLVVLFTNTVSHKMIANALKAGERSGAKIVRSHSSSACALKSILEEHCLCSDCACQSDCCQKQKQ